MSGGSSAGLFPERPSDVPVGLVQPSAQTLLLEMRHDVQDEKATPVPKTAVMPQVQKCQKQCDSDDDSVGSPLKGIYEVEKLLDMRETADGKRQFLIKWGPSWREHP